MILGGGQGVTGGHGVTGGQGVTGGHSLLGLLLANARCKTSKIYFFNSALIYPSLGGTIEVPP